MERVGTVSTISFIRESTAFLKYAAQNGLTGPERELWHVLMHLFNENARGNQFPDGFIRLPNKMILALVSYTDDTLSKARNRLAQRGLIEYVRGSRREDVPMYRMIWLTAARAPEGGAEEEPKVAPTVYPKVAPKNSDKNSEYYYDYIDYDGTETDLREAPSDYGYWEDEEEPPRAREETLEEFEGGSPDRQETSEQIKAGFLEHFGRRPHRAELRRIGETASILGIPPVMVGIAVRVAAEHNAGAPAMYITQVLNDFDRWGIYTPEEYGRHLYHFREGDVPITEQQEEAQERRKAHREAMADAADTGRGFQPGRVETAEARPCPGGGPAAGGGGGGLGDGQPAAGQRWQPWDPEARQGGPGGHPADPGQGTPGRGGGMGAGL